MEYLDFLNEDLETLGFKCYFSNSYLYLMGTRGLNQCSSTQIVLYLRKKKFSIVGHDLEIEELSKNEIRVKGGIESLSIID